MLREAAAWLTRLRSAESHDATQREFVEWLKQSPQHVKHYLELASLDVTLQDSALYDDSALGVSTHSESLNIVQWPQVKSHAPPAVRQQPSRRSVRRLFMAASVIAVLALGGLYAIRWVTSSDEYRSRLGEIRSFELIDGSVVTLNTQSEIRVQYTQVARDIELVRGEALFKVAKRSNLPFRVHVNNTVVQAIGTEFNVYRKATGAIVTVMEGRVAILPPQAQTLPEPQRLELEAGEQVAVASSRVVRRLDPPEVARVTTWTQRRLVFDRVPVAEVVAELNRYNREQLSVGDPQLARRAVTGTFESSDPESFVQFLKQQGGVAVIEEPNGERLLIGSQAGGNSP
jgi:transmembrane sensor